MEHICEPARSLPVQASYDVVVCGGGIAGIAAALAATRHGAKTLLIEQQYLLGGLATAGLIAIYLPLCDGLGRQVTFGIAEELLKLSVCHGYAGSPRGYHAWLCGETALRNEERYQVEYDPHVFAIQAEQLLAHEGVTVLYGTGVCAVAKQNDRITHVITENKSGRCAFAAGRVVDATGDADIVHLAGEAEAVFQKGNLLAGWYYEVTETGNHLRMVGASDAPPDATDVTPLVKQRFGGLDAAERSRMVRLSHEKTLERFLEKGEVTPRHSLATLATVPQLRMTRRLAGAACQDTDRVHTEEPDSVGLFADWRKAGPVYELPAGCLYGKTVENLYCAGRNVSVSDDLWDVTRVIPVCALSGQAAGTMAALFVSSRELSVPALQETLRRDGVVLHEKEI